MTSITYHITNAILANTPRTSKTLMRDMSTCMCAHQRFAGVDASIEDCVCEGCRDESLLLFWERKRLVEEDRLVVVATRIVNFCGATLIIDSVPVTLLAVSIVGSLDVFAEVRAMSNERCVMEELGEDKQEGRGSISGASSPTTHLVSSTDISLGPPVELEPSLGGEKTVDQPKTGCRHHRTNMESKSGEESSASPLSRRAARKARKARTSLAQSSVDSVVQAGSPPPRSEDQPQKVMNSVPCSSVAIQPRQGSKMAGKVTSKAALVSNMSTAQEASTPSQTRRKGAKSGRHARKTDPAPPAVGSDCSDMSVVAEPSISSFLSHRSPVLRPKPLM